MFLYLEIAEKANKVHSFIFFLSLSLSLSLSFSFPFLHRNVGVTEGLVWQSGNCLIFKKLGISQLRREAGQKKVSVSKIVAFSK